MAVRFLKSLALVVSVMALLAPGVADAGPGDGLFRAAQLLSQPEEAESDAQRRARLQNVRNILDQIVQLYPESDLAARIRRREVIDGLDVAALDAALAEDPAAAAGEEAGQAAGADIEAADEDAQEGPDAAAALQQEGTGGTSAENPFVQPDDMPAEEEQSAPTLPTVDKTAPSNPFTEDTMALRRSERREVQRRLALAGFDPGGADGVFGNRTRAALSEWQKENGFAPSGYLNVPQLAYLRAQTEAAYRARPAATPRKPRRVKVCSSPVFGVRVCEYRKPGRRAPSPGASAPER